VINRSKISTCFTELVGWRESAEAPNCFDELTDSLQTSTSGIYFNDLPLVNLEVINECMTPDYPDVNTYLENAYSAGLQRLMDDFVKCQKKDVYSKSLLKNGDIGVYAENMRKITAKSGRFVGFEIRPKESLSIRAEILQFGGAFDTLQTGLPIYFYSSLQLEPIGEYTVDITKVNSLEWFEIVDNPSGSGVATSPLQFMCDYINENNGHGQRYWVGYYENDLTGNAVQTQTPCYTCATETKKFEFNKYVHIVPVEIGASATYDVSRELFDIDNIGYGQSTNGLFLKVNVVCDTTQVFCDNVQLFATALQKEVGAKILWDCYNSTKFNGTASTKKSDYRMMAEKLERELNGYAEEGRYIKGDLENLTIDFSNLDEVCVGKSKKTFGLHQL